MTEKKKKDYWPVSSFRCHPHIVDTVQKMADERDRSNSWMYNYLLRFALRSKFQAQGRTDLMPREDRLEAEEEIARKLDDE